MLRGEPDPPDDRYSKENATRGSGSGMLNTALMLPWLPLQDPFYIMKPPVQVRG